MGTVRNVSIGTIHNFSHRKRKMPQALSTDSVERLPVFNKTALRHYKLSLEADDWCIPSKEPLDLAVYRAAK